MRPILMHPALLTLMRLRARGSCRRLFGGLRTAKGAVYVVVSFGLLAMWLGPALFFGLTQDSSDPALVRNVVPAALLMFCLMNLVSIRAESGIAFQPAEVDFLFSGPFRRRDLLVYKLLGTACGAVGVALLFSLFLMPHVASWAAGFVGAFLGLLFIQLIYLNVSLLAATVAERTFTAGRKVALLATAVALGVGLSVALSRSEAGVVAVISRFRESWAGSAVLAPFEVFGKVAAARTWLPELLGWSAVGLLMNLGLAALVLRSDAHFLEAAANASQKLYERMQQVRRGTPWFATARGALRGRIPPLPWMGGAGPIAWRQLLTALRGVHGALVLLAIMALAVGAPLIFSQRASIASGPILVGIGAMSVLWLPMLIQFDFRADVDRIETLKTLPIRPSAVVIGQLLTPVLITTLLEILLFGLFGVLEPGLARWLGLAAAFAVPVNVLVYALENLLFLLFPYRLPVGGALDVQASLRQVLSMFLKLAALVIAAGVAAGAGAAASALAGSSQAAFWSGAWAAVTAMAAALVPVLSAAYRRFDPSADTP